MGRASRRSGADTRERILERAIPLFAAHGFAGTSVRMVAQAAEVNVATLAYHFIDKQGLYDHAVQLIHLDLARDLDRVRWPVDPGDLVETVVRVTWEFVKAHREHIRLLMRHVLDQGQHPSVVVERWAGQLLERGEAVVTPFRPEWPPAQRRMLVLAFQHLLVRLVLEDRGQLAAMLGHPEDVDAEIVRWFAGMLRRELGIG